MNGVSVQFSYVYDLENLKSYLAKEIYPKCEVLGVDVRTSYNQPSSSWVYSPDSNNQYLLNTLKNWTNFFSPIIEIWSLRYGETDDKLWNIKKTPRTKVN